MNSWVADGKSAWPVGAAACSHCHQHRVARAMRGQVRRLSVNILTTASTFALLTVASSALTSYTL